MKLFSAQHSKHGFTLVELSITLTLIGLMVGALLAGQTLVRNYELRSILTEKEEYVAAITTFQGKYNYYPGDFPNARDYWPVATHPTVSNGDGNGNITWNTAEMFYVWPHLEYAELISEHLTGVAGPLYATDAVAGTNVPASETLGGWVAAAVGMASSLSPLFDGKYNDLLILSTDGSNGGGVVAPDEALSIELKIDDGMPATGKIVTTIATACTTKANGTVPTTVTDLDALYAIEQDDKTNCALVFREAF